MNRISYFVAAVLVLIAANAIFSPKSKPQFIEASFVVAPAMPETLREIELSSETTPVTAASVTTTSETTTAVTQTSAAADANEVTDADQLQNEAERAVAMGLIRPEEIPSYIAERKFAAHAESEQFQNEMTELLTEEN